jgi:hypothetical protein
MNVVMVPSRLYRLLLLAATLCLLKRRNVQLLFTPAGIGSRGDIGEDLPGWS